MAGGEERPSGGGDDKKRYPVGFRFQPTFPELVEFYLLPKLLDQPSVPNDAVIEADAYECDPEILTKKYEERGADDNWFFLSPRSRRYPGGDRPTRRTADNRGRWKPSTGQSKTGKNAAAGHSKGKKNIAKNLSVGAIEFTENTLAYYLGEPKDETKTKWLMHELTVPEPEKEKEPDGEKPRDHMLLNKYVMCNIYKSPLKKWKQPEGEAGCSTSSAPALDEDVPSSSQSGPSPPESSGEASASAPAPAPASKREGKRPALEQPNGHAIAPNKRGSQQMTFTMPSERPVPAHANGGGGGMRMPPPVGVAGAAAGYYHGVPGLPPLMQWPPAVCGSMQGPVQLQQRPQLMYRHNRMAPVQEPPVLKLHPPHRVAATGPGARGPTMTRHPPNQVAGQPVRAPSFPQQQPQQQQQQQQQQMMPEMTPYEQRVLMQLVAEMKLQRGMQENWHGGHNREATGQSADANVQDSHTAVGVGAGHQQQATPTAALTQLAWFDEGASHPAAAATGLVPYPQFLTSHNLYPCSDVQLQQQYHHHQQSSSAIPTPTDSVHPGAVAPVEATPVDDNVPSKLPEVSCQEIQTNEAGAGTATTIASNLSQIWPL